jgi:predicted metal-dependent hydrolase
MRLPDYLIDYVILHELVHTKIKNHSSEFWQLLNIVSGNAKKLDREVKDFRIQIY